ncbi:MAG: hypothetical protein JWN98_2256, partial [Abditibacteriota bacterium]|nr:hypothetical protein [Abditibacteriota bacterium]
MKPSRKPLMMLALPVAVMSASFPAQTKTVYVAPNGNDKWMGTLPAANAAKTNGPFASLGKARDVLRGTTGEKKIVLRGGTHFLRTPLELWAQDSGLKI